MKAILRSVYLLLAFMALAVPAHAGPWEDGVAATKRGEYATALRLWRPLAEQGDAFAQAAIGTIYRDGLGVPQDDAEAVKWFRMAAEQGQPDAQNRLGDMYYHGLIVTQDYGEAAKWHRMAAEQGVAFAQTTLGVSYANGQGVPQDYVLAHMWFNLAAAAGDNSAPRRRDILAKRMTPDQIAEAQRMAREWLATHQ